MNTVPAGDGRLAHIVFFTLRDKSAEATAKLVAACHEYLTGHPGTHYFSAGTRVPDLSRAVNDQDYEVGLHVVFDDRKAHDLYQTDPRHLQFIDENKGNWERVRVFDSYVGGDESK